MKGYKILFATGVLLIIIYLVAQYNKPLPTNWSPSYLAKEKIPYGTYILRNRINDVFPKATVEESGKSVYNTLKNRTVNASTYIIVAQRADINQVDFEEMKKFMQAGNTIFIAAYDLGKIAKTLKIRTQSSFNKDSRILNFTNPNLKTEASYGFERGIGGQYYRQVDTAKTTVLGINGAGQPNFIQYRYGKGALYLIAEPGFYTNFSLLDQYGGEYAAKTLSYIQNSRHVIIDQYFSTTEGETTDLLRVFFKHPELKWAYYIAFFSLITFVLYDMKRRQRIIPVADPYQNASLDFVRVVGSVYYHERNNLDIANKMINYFSEHLRSRYFLKTSDIDQNFATTLMEKTGINEVSAKTLTRYFIQLPKINTFSDQELIVLNESIEQFYKNTQPNGRGTI